MNKRQKKKTQAQMGWVLISAWVPPQVREDLNRRATGNHRSTSAEINAILDDLLNTKRERET